MLVTCMVKVGLTAVIMFNLLPYIALIIGSLLPNSLTDRGIGANSLSGWTWDNHIEMWRSGYHDYGVYFFNTIVVSLSTVIIVLFLSVFGAYGLTRYRVRGRELFQYAVLWGYIFPPIVLVLPYAILLTEFGLNGTRFGLILANVAFCFPFGLWLMIQYMEAVSRNFDATAAADGANWRQTLWYVIIPRSLPGIAAVGMFSFILSWNDVALSLVLATEDTRTIAAGVKESILDTDEIKYGTFAAASLWVATLAVIFFGLLQAWIDKRLRAEAED